MEQLLSITTVPLKYELSVTHARMEYTSKVSQLQEQRISGRGLQISNIPAKLNINTKDARNSLAPDTFLSVKQAAARGLQNAQDVTAQYAREGKQLLDAKPGDDVLGQIFSQRVAQPTGEFQLAFLPSVGPEIQYQEPNFDMQYEADKLAFDVRVTNGDVQYVPGDISMDITQWPDVVIKYMGSPMYVPPSVAERFEASA